MQATTTSVLYDLRKQTKSSSNKTSQRTEKTSLSLVQSSKVFEEIQNKASKLNSVVKNDNSASPLGETPKVSAMNQFLKNSIYKSDQIGAHLSQTPSIKFY